SQYHPLAFSLRARSLLLCSSSIRCSIRFEMIRVSKNSARQSSREPEERFAGLKRRNGYQTYESSTRSGMVAYADRDNSPLFEIVLVLVRLDHVAGFIINANHDIDCLGDRASGTLRYESTTDQIWRDRGRGRALQA